MESSNYNVGQLYAYERDKVSQVSSLFSETFSRVQGIIEKFSADPACKDIIEELSSEFTSFQGQITTVLSEKISEYQRDPFEEISGLQLERQQGYEKLAEMQDEIRRLHDQKNAATKLIEELQTKNQNISNNSYQSDENNDPPFGNPLHFDDPQDTIVQLTNEVETAQMNVGQLQRRINDLTSENKRLSSEVLSLRDQVTSSHNLNLNANNIFSNVTNVTSYNTQNQQDISQLKSIIEQLKVENGSLHEERRIQQSKIEDLQRKLENRGGQAKHLIRSGTVTDWNQKDLEALKHEMAKQKLALMMDRQIQPEQAPMIQNNQNKNINNISTIDENTENDNNNENSESQLFRSDSKTEWQQSEMEKLKQDLMDQMQEVNQEALDIQLTKQDELRFPIEQTPTNLVGGGDNAGISMAELDKRQREMKEELQKQSKQQIMERTEKSFALRDSVIIPQRAHVNEDEALEAQKLLEVLKISENKNKLKEKLEKQDQVFIATQAEPTQEQYSQLDLFLRESLGLMNEELRKNCVDGLRSLFRRNNPIIDEIEQEQQEQQINGQSLLGDFDDDPNNNLFGDTPGGDFNTPGGDYLTPGGNGQNDFINDGYLNEIGIGQEFETPGGPYTGTTPGNIRQQIADVRGTEWSKISADQEWRIAELMSVLNTKHLKLMQLQDDIIELKKDNERLTNEIDQIKEQNYNNNNNENNNNGGGTKEALQKQIDHLEDMKIELIKSTAKEIDHLRNMIRDMQKQINNGKRR